MHKFDPMKPVQTRDGRKARIICADNKDYYSKSIVALVREASGYEIVHTFRADGKYHTYSDGHAYDLVNTPEKKVIKGWINMYPNGPGGMYDTLEAAKAVSNKETILTTIYVEQEYEL